MNKQKPRSDQAFQLDQWLALHQKPCWLLLAALALLGAASIAFLAPKNTSTVLSVALAIGLMLLYTWITGAPVRAIREWVRRIKEETTREKARSFLDFLLKLEQTLPSMRKKELAFTIVTCKANVLATLGRKEEALALLRSFDQMWDAAQWKFRDKLIQIISGEAPSADTEPKEQP